MKGSIIATVSLLTLLALFLAVQNNYQPSLGSIIQNGDECTEKMQAECGLELERTAKNCAKAFATDGAGIISDIRCLKDLKADK